MVKLLKSIVRIAYVALALVYFAACSNSSSGSSATTTSFGDIQVVFTATVTDDSGSTIPLKNVLLNVANVLVNTTAMASTSATNWRTIPLPDQAPAGSPPGAFQMDLNSVAGLPVVYNTTQILTGNYQTLQIQLDPSPGAIVPLCAGASLEGCILYPIQLNSAALVIQINAPVQTSSPTTVVVNLNFDITDAPTSTGGPYVVDLTASQVTSPVPGVGTVLATVKGNSTVTGGTVQTLTAFVAGTDTFVTSIPIGPNNTFMLTLPASEAGTLYDLVVAGNNSTYSALRIPPLMPNTPSIQTFSVQANQTVGAIAGQVVDACTGLGIEGATVELLVAPANQNTITLMSCFSPTTIGECIVAISTMSDVTGQYPELNALNNPTGSFAEIPSLPFPKGTPTPPIGPYIISVSAPGYDTLLAQGTSNASTTQDAGICIVNGTKGSCNFPLTSVFISGTVTLDAAPAPGQDVSVIVFGETSGTTNLVAMSDPILFTSSTPTKQSYTMRVPSNNELDFFAEATDTYQGAADPYTGHTIDVGSKIATPPTPCATAGATLNFSLSCAGHGSVTGNLVGANNLTSVVLSKNGVQLMTGNAIAPVPSASPTPWSYAICAPGDSYTITRYQPTPTASGTPVPTPISSASIAIPLASPTSSGCPTTCLKVDGSCPGNCASTNQDLGNSQ